MEREKTQQDGRTTLELLRRARVATSALGEVLSRFDTTPDQWLILELLARSGSSGLTMNELRIATGLSGGTLTRVVDKLIKDALAFREVDAVDRRRIVVWISTNGVELYNRSKSAVDELESSLLPRS